MRNVQAVPDLGETRMPARKAYTPRARPVGSHRSQSDLRFAREPGADGLYFGLERDDAATIFLNGFDQSIKGSVKIVIALIRKRKGQLGDRMTRKFKITFLA